MTLSLPSAASLALSAAFVMTRLVGTAVVAVPDTLYTWQKRHRMRRELLSLDDRLLRDMGLSRCDAEREGRRPFWRT